MEALYQFEQKKRSKQAEMITKGGQYDIPSATLGP
jgi:hypothetical protein